MALASPLLELPLMDADRDRVESALLTSVRTRDAYLTEIASHLIVAGGKRLRPVMTIAAAQVGSNVPVSDNVILGGISCELVHLGSLYHDDVMDEAATRRGVETVNAKWGDLQAILVSKGIPAWIDFWGHDVNHDWPWWRKMLPYYVDRLGL